MIRKLAIGLAVVVGSIAAFDAWIATTSAPPLPVATSVEVLAHDGRLLRAFTVADGRWRLATLPSAVDPTYLAILFAYEDARFARHGGVDPRALLRASWQALRAGRIVSGGSTLTMQVARLLEDGSTGSLGGKIRQMRVAWYLERHYEKEEILGAYLQLAPMGGNLEGVRAGSLAWFGREPDRLTPAQAALLVALPQAPALRDPVTHPQAAHAARARVLARALEVGVLAADDGTVANAEPLPERRLEFPAHAPHLADRLEATRAGERALPTTIDLDLQRSLESLAGEYVPVLPPRASLALVVANIAEGSVLASVGSVAYGDEERDGFVDVTTALRSPGSTLKPLVYALAFDQGIAHPETLLEDRATEYGSYAPTNFGGGYRGLVSAREALQASLNVPAVALAEAIGPARIITALRTADVDVDLPGVAPGLAVALGGVGVTLEGLVQLYATMARGGEVVHVHARPEEGTLGARVLSEQAAWHVADILGGTAPPPGYPNDAVAYKTGTSGGYRDAWAIGFDGAHVVGVWVGRADGAPIPGLTGVRAAAPILFDAFARVAPERTPRAAPPAGTLRSTHAELPLALQRLGRPSLAGTRAPRLTFPPDGAVVASLDGAVFARVADGRPPFTWLVNGAPSLVSTQTQEVQLDLEERGFVTLAVVDADGGADQVVIEVRSE